MDLENDARQRARKALIQQRYMAKKLANETVEQRQIRFDKAKVYCRRWKEKDPDKAKAIIRGCSRRAYRADPARARAQCAGSRSKYGEQWNAARRAKYAADPTQVKARNIADYAKHRTKRVQATRQFRADHPGRAAEACRRFHQKDPAAHRARSKKWAAENPERVAANAAAWRAANRSYARTRRAANPQIKIAHNLRRRLAKAMDRAKAGKKGKSTFVLVGCSAAQLKRYLEGQFTTGMSWDNYGEWHIDHCRPICTFDLLDLAQQERAFHFTNLQPLWAADNLAKPRKHWRATAAE